MVSPSNHMSQATVLVGFAESGAAPEVVWSLVDAGFHVIAFARRGRASALRKSRHVVCHEICPPETSLQGALSDLHSLLISTDLKRTGAEQILFPLDDTAVWLSSRLQLDGHWQMAGPRGASADLALDKYLQIQKARDAGFDVPRTIFARTTAEIGRLTATESFPIILKPAESVPTRQGRVYGCRKWICANHDELERALSEWAERVPLLVQPFIAGTGEGIFGLAASEGVRAWSSHRRLRMMNPQGSGSSACISQPVPPDLRSRTEQLIKRAEWRGLFMVELLRDHSGTAWFVEFNGRPWGSLALSRRQGLEYPAWHVSLALDEQSPAGVGLSSLSDIVCRHIGRELLHLLFVLRGPRSKALTNWPSIWKTISEVIRIRRGDAFYNWRRDDPKVFIADCFCTILQNVFKSKN